MSEMEPHRKYWLLIDQYNRFKKTEEEKEDYALVVLKDLAMYPGTPQYIINRLLPIVARHLIAREARDG